MKISKLGFTYSPLRFTPLNTKGAENPIKPATSGKDIFRCYYGRDLVSFAGSLALMRYNEDFFRLPEGCTPDGFQREAGQYINEGKNVLVEAPTGTGKTAIAHYAISKNMAEGKKTFYTTPLKALSNQKLTEFREIYGDENVGILTGDRQENTDAPVIIMTTEIYRNMVLANSYGESSQYEENPGTVIFDEFHYLGDNSRGPVWEESVMFTPKDVQMLALSATIGNPEELSDWMNRISLNETKLISVPKQARHVPLEFGTIVTEAYLKDEALRRKDDYADYEKYEGVKNTKPSVRDFKYAISELREKDRLPAIFFVFSKRFSRNLVDYLATGGDDLTNEREKREIEKIVEKHKKQGYVGSDLDINALQKGYAMHNAGIIPAQKALIEELFQKKLIKVVFATETLAAGINMPAKTVVITSPYKPTEMIDGERFRLINPNEFMQMSGRAGRRGMDKKGYVYTMPVDVQGKREFKKLQMSDSIPIESRYEPDYSFITEYYKHYDSPERLNEAYKKSFYAVKNGDSTLELEKLTASKTDVLAESGFMRKDKDGKISLTDKGFFLSGITGDNDMLIAEVFSGLKDMPVSPEVLAMLAASIVCEGNGSSSFDCVKEAVNNSDFEIHEVYSTMYRSIKKTLERLGKRIDCFSDFSDLKKFVQGLKSPEVSEAVLKANLFERYELLKTAELINDVNVHYTSDELYKAVKRKQTVPNAVLFDTLKDVEAYIKANGLKDVESYREQLKKEAEKNVKGPKAQSVSRKKRSEIKSELKKLKRYALYYKLIPEMIHQNHEFLVQHDVEKIKHDCSVLREQIAILTSKNDVLSEIEAMEALENGFSDKEFEEYSKINREMMYDGVIEICDKAEEIAKCEKNNGIKPNVFEIATEYGKSVYEWAVLNKYNPNTKANWIQIVKLINTNSLDEGSLYRGIMQTADLIKQIEEISEAGAEVALKNGDCAEYEKYKRLAKTARTAGKLIVNPPIAL